MKHLNDHTISTQKSSIWMERKVPEELRNLWLAINSLAELADHSKKQSKYESESCSLIVDTLIAFK